MMIECKQSTLPYTFFLLPNTPDKLRVRNFPVFARLFSDMLSLVEQGKRPRFAVDLSSALGLDMTEFITQCPAYSMSFTKCVRKGKELELSGSEPFNSLVLPLLKAIRHYKLAEVPPKTAHYFDCDLVVGIGVVDAPMVGVEVSGNGNELSMLPWVRVVRHETGDDLNAYKTTTLFAIDIVHKDFFREYLSKHLFPFASTFSGLVFKHQQVLASGQGMVAGGRGITMKDIEPWLRPIPPDSETVTKKNQQELNVEKNSVDESK